MTDAVDQLVRSFRDFSHALTRLTTVVRAVNPEALADYIAGSPE
jgi:hypothetical protein